MLRVFLVFLSLRLSVALPAALTCPSLCSLIAWCAPWSTRGDRRSISVADKGLAPRSMCPLTGLACILLTRMSTSERRVGEGRFFFILPPCLLFPLFYFAWRCAQPLRATAQEGCWHFVCSISWTHRLFDEASNDAGAGNEWMSARRQKTRGQLHGNGELFAPSSSFVFERRARRVSSNRAVAVRRRRWKDTAAKETNAGQKRNL